MIPHRINAGMRSDEEVRAVKYRNRIKAGPGHLINAIRDRLDLRKREND